MNGLFRQILAIDLDGRIDDLRERLAGLSEGVIITAPNPEQALAAIGSKDAVDAILISIHQRLDQTFLANFRHVRYIGVFGTSRKCIDLEHCSEHGIAVTNVSDYCDRETAEWVIMHVLRACRDRERPRSAFLQRLGIVGVGSVGKMVLRLGHGLGMPLFYNATAPHEGVEEFGAQFLSKEEIFAQCDIISFHTPAHSHWLSEKILRHAKKDLIMINTCLGKISLDRDLERFLGYREDVGLIMDAIAGQSYEGLSPRANISKAVAFFTIDSHEKLIDKFVGNIKSFLRL